MKRLFPKFICLILFLCNMAVNVNASQMDRHYIDQQQILIDQDSIFVQLADEWYTTNTLRNDDQGVYVSEQDIIPCGARAREQPKLWQCPYCHYWWKIGEKCGNDKCATNNW